MSRLLPVLAMTAALALAACAGGGTTGTASAGPPEPAASAPASRSRGIATPEPGAGVCAPSTEAGTVEAAMTGNAFSPGTIQAKVGDVITWTNGDGVPAHGDVQGRPDVHDRAARPG